MIQGVAMPIAPPILEKNERKGGFLPLRGGRSSPKPDWICPTKKSRIAPSPPDSWICPWMGRNEKGMREIRGKKDRKKQQKHNDAWSESKFNKNSILSKKFKVEKSNFK